MAGGSDPGTGAATALGLPDLGTRPVLEELAGYLAGRRVLMVLDNSELLAGACTDLVTVLLSLAPGLRVLATSRHTLGITGEHVLTVPSLTEQDTAELFLDRATALRSDFEVGEHRAAVTRLCADLDRLPLAIEPAASRLRTLTVEQVVDRLENRFALLTTNGAAPRRSWGSGGVTRLSYSRGVEQEDEQPISADALDRVTWALRRAEWGIQARKDQRLRPLGVAAAQYSMLISVHTDPGLTGAELARFLNITPQAVASQVARLEERGQLERRPHPRHRHVQELHLTDAGRETLRAADAVIVEIERQITVRLGSRKAAQLRVLLDEVADAVREP
ncbi:MarR family winged helix-turn-helix transcriptional regulator [Streptomyces geranii]|uniref:MarR family winged helix-turn-helix transcriptional regulator n=1 Tax=Streptomyces geranii TaxID=2058923 RepID=UPI001E5FD5AE|nr:MarR family transcriptional regulator [Streptomyces geranii]